MAVTKRAKSVVDRVVGTAKETMGKATGNRSTRAKGTVQRLKGQAGQTVQKTTGRAKSTATTHAAGGARPERQM